jgi:putative endonuclease
VNVRLTTGAEAEALVAAHLQRQGFVIVARNARIGRLELDLIARRGELLVFCEVRPRRSSAFVNPIETIDRAKTARIRKAAAQWLAQHPQGARELRFDAAAVLFEHDPPALSYYEAAF